MEFFFYASINVFSGKVDLLLLSSSFSLDCCQKKKKSVIPQQLDPMNQGSNSYQISNIEINLNQTSSLAFLPFCSVFSFIPTLLI